MFLTYKSTLIYFLDIFLLTAMYTTSQYSIGNEQGYNTMHSYPFINDAPHSTKKAITKTQQVPPGIIHIKPVWKPVKLDEKPPFSYATLIAHAILSSEHRKLTLSDIYQWISEKYPCYSMKDRRWQNSIRHNLSLQKAFIKLERNNTSPSGKGCYWTIVSGYEQQFIDNLMKCELGGCSKQSNITTHKQFKKFIDDSKNNVHKKKSSHLFTIFRMNPIQNKRKKSNKKETKRKQVIEYDSDCDSGVDFGSTTSEVFSKKEVLAFSSIIEPTATDYTSTTYTDNLMDLNLLNTDFFWPLLLENDFYNYNLENDAFLPQQQESSYLYDTTAAYY